jgi:hypothetical protein
MPALKMPAVLDRQAMLDRLEASCRPVDPKQPAASDRGDVDDAGDENGWPWLAFLPVNVADRRNRSRRIVASIGRYRGH